MKAWQYFKHYKILTHGIKVVSSLSNRIYFLVASEIFLTTINPEKTSKISPISLQEKEKALGVVHQVLSLHSESKERLSRECGNLFMKVLTQQRVTNHKALTRND